MAITIAIAIATYQKSNCHYHDRWVSRKRNLEREANGRRRTRKSQHSTAQTVQHRQYSTDSTVQYRKKTIEEEEKKKSSRKKLSSLWRG